MRCLNRASFDMTIRFGMTLRFDVVMLTVGNITSCLSTCFIT